MERRANGFMVDYSSSYCCYDFVFSSPANLTANFLDALGEEIHLRLAEWLRTESISLPDAESPMEVISSRDGVLSVSLNHAIVDAQRGLSLVMAALERVWPSSRGGELPSQTLSKVRSDRTSEFRLPMENWASRVDRTVTQSILLGLSDVLKGEVIRMIISSDPDVNSVGLGNRFSHVHLNSDQFGRLLDSDKNTWKKVLNRSANRELKLTTSSTGAHAMEYITVTSVGSLRAIEEKLAGFGVADFRMYPDSVFSSPRVITIYSVFRELRLILSGRNVDQGMCESIIGSGWSKVERE